MPETIHQCSRRNKVSKKGAGHLRTRKVSHGPVSKLVLPVLDPGGTPAEVKAFQELIVAVGASRSLLLISDIHLSRTRASNGLTLSGKRFLVKTGHCRVRPSSVSVLFTLFSSAIMSIEAAEPGYLLFFFLVVRNACWYKHWMCRLKTPSASPVTHSPAQYIRELSAYITCSMQNVRHLSRQ
ncbi:hypothetical protein D9C73_010536 [Collichthys lucidus]|uniref:Uncharacterized protein n=1 Tax=Collichthys lucidus TaxID=240159 RepID=A0A4U5UP46_COLLU|nr:hypothetical protein D9C73_010536 [Collichthys lucidus]